MNSDELLQSTTLAHALSVAPPWRSDNLRVVAAGEDGAGSYVTMEAINTRRNGHLEQWCATGMELSGTLAVAASMWAVVKGGAGINVYLHFHPTEDQDTKVFQLDHPGDGAWHRLERAIPLPDRPLYRVRVLVVLRAGVFRLRDVSLRQAPPRNRALEGTLAREHISMAYYEAVMGVVAKHPSAADPEFRDKLSRYLLGSNRKGMATIAAMEQRLAPLGQSVVGARLLDLGCGSGGVLVGALKAGAAWAEGWEINAEKRGLSEINVTTCGVDRERAIVHDRTMESPAGDVAPFDIVFCEEVLEHVKDLGAAIATLARCLRPGGAGYVTMPNGYALQSVLADPHLQLFGIALLDRFEAQPLATALKNHTHYSEMMGAYCRHEDYVARFEAAGLVLAAVEEVTASARLMKQLADDVDAIGERRENLRADWGDKVDGETLTLLEERLDVYLAEVRARLENVTGNGAGTEEREAFVRDFGQAHFAYVVSHKKGSM